jgi:hypothetical protein
MTVTAHRNYPDESIGVNKSFSDDVHLFKMGENIRVSVTSNKPIDVFIMTTADYGAGLGPKYPGNFTPTFEVLNTTSTVFNFTIPDSGAYVVVVDNEVNNINGSANPTDTVTFSYIRTDDDDHIAPIVAAISLFCISVVSVLVIIFIVVIVIIVIAARKKKAQPPQPFAPAPAYGQPQYGQPQYGQPAQQPYQPPPGQYQPPPHPPGSPPG